MVGRVFAGLLHTLTCRAVANLPAEITHLFEEVQAKDELIQETRRTIGTRDSSLQKFIKLNGSLVQNPKEEPYSKLIVEQYERSQILQEEKIGLVEKAAALVRLSMNVCPHSLTHCSWTGM
jgi:inhibitor of growth protein 3